MHMRLLGGLGGACVEDMCACLLGGLGGGVCRVHSCTPARGARRGVWGHACAPARGARRGVWRAIEHGITYGGASLWQQPEDAAS